MTLHTRYKKLTQFSIQWWRKKEDLLLSFFSLLFAKNSLMIHLLAPIQTVIVRLCVRVCVLRQQNFVLENTEYINCIQCWLTDQNLKIWQFLAAEKKLFASMKWKKKTKKIYYSEVKTNNKNILLLSDDINDKCMCVRESITNSLLPAYNRHRFFCCCSWAISKFATQTLKKYGGHTIIFAQI